MRSASAKRDGLDEDLLDTGIYDYQTSDAYSDKEKAILEYVEYVANDPEQIDAAYYDKLREYLSEEEIIELGIFLTYNLGFHTFFGTLKFYPMFAPDGRLVSQEESERIYGAAPKSLAGEAAE